LLLRQQEFSSMKWEHPDKAFNTGICTHCVLHNCELHRGVMALTPGMEVWGGGPLEKMAAELGVGR
jgi:hypothetical protein